MTARQYRYCLRPTDILTSPWHIRGTSPLEPSGLFHPAETPSLCGALEIGQGVDRFNERGPTLTRVRGLREIGAVCEACAKAYLAEVTS